MFVFTRSKSFYKFLSYQIIVLIPFVLLYIYKQEFFIDYYFFYTSLLSLLLVNFSLYFKYVLKLDYIIDQVSNVIAGKPFVPIKIYTPDEFGLLAFFFNDVTANLKKISSVIKEEERMSEELSVAASIQRSVLPKSVPSVPNFDIVCKTRPSEEIGGDSFAVRELNDEYFLYIGDVTGHGAPAGLIMMMVSTLFDVLLADFPDCKDVAVNINHILTPRVNATMFMTSLFFQYSPSNKYIEYTGCGHEHIIIYRADEGVTEVMPAGGIALAMSDDISSIAEKKKINLSKGDVICLYSDGITEAMNENGELFGLDHLSDLVKKYSHQNTSLDIFSSISKDLSDFTNKTVQIDDMTLIVLKYNDTVVENLKDSQFLTDWNV
ncbi:SpoIIE family protein phosphatase [bacterium]|jgi:serine phosphatase RsbU (regulator of sigma subunit)|nr:SpoIIE family protein phosphatase [bacterium]